MPRTVTPGRSESLSAKLRPAECRKSTRFFALADSAMVALSFAGEALEDEWGDRGIREAAVRARIGAHRRVSCVGQPLAPVLLAQWLVMGVPFINSYAKKRDQVVAIDLGGLTTKAVHVQRQENQREKKA